MEVIFQRISDIFASKDENSQELAFLLLSNYECPRWLALQIAFNYLRRELPSYVANFINQYFPLEEEREKVWMASRFLGIPTHKRADMYYHIFDSTNAEVLQYAAAFREFLPDCAILCAYRKEFLYAFRDSVVVCCTYYDFCRKFEFPDAIFWLETAIAWQIPDTALYFYLGEAYLKNQQFERAETYLLVYLEQVPAQVNDNFYPLDEFYHDSYRYFPDTLQAYNLLISLYADFQSFRSIEKALEYCQKGMNLAPFHYQSPYVRYADLLLENPDFPRAQILNLYKQHISNQELKKGYRLYLEQKKNNAIVYEKMLLAAEELNNCNEILHACKMSENWEKQLVTVLEKKGDYWQAEVLIDKILKKNPQNATALYWKPIVEDKIYRLK